MLKYHNIAFEYHLQISVSVTMVKDNIVILKVIKFNVVFFFFGQETCDYTFKKIVNFYEQIINICMNIPTK